MQGGQPTTGASTTSPGASSANAASLSPGAAPGALSPGAASQAPPTPAAPAPPCCDTGRPIIADPVSGQTVCSCQYDSARLALSSYPRLPPAGVGVGVYGAPYPSTDQNPYPSIGVDSSAFYSPLVSCFFLYAFSRKSRNRDRVSFKWDMNDWDFYRNIFSTMRQFSVETRRNDRVNRIPMKKNKSMFSRYETTRFEHDRSCFEIRTFWAIFNER